MKITVELDTENPEHLPILLMLVTGASGMAKVEDKPAAPAEDKPKPAARRQPAKPAPEPEPEPQVEEPAAQEEQPADDLGLDDPEDAADPIDEEPKFTEDDVRKALKNYRDINGADAVMAILKEHGASGMGSLKPEHYASVMKLVR